MEGQALFFIQNPTQHYPRDVLSDCQYNRPRMIGICTKPMQRLYLNKCHSSLTEPSLYLLRFYTEIIRVVLSLQSRIPQLNLPEITYLFNQASPFSMMRVLADMVVLSQNLSSFELEPQNGEGHDWSNGKISMTPRSHDPGVDISSPI